MDQEEEDDRSTREKAEAESVIVRSSSPIPAELVGRVREKTKTKRPKENIVCPFLEGPLFSPVAEANFYIFEKMESHIILSYPVLSSQPHKYPHKKINERNAIPRDTKTENFFLGSHQNIQSILRHVWQHGLRRRRDLSAQLMNIGFSSVIVVYYSDFFRVKSPALIDSSLLPCLMTPLSPLYSLNPPPPDPLLSHLSTISSSYASSDLLLTDENPLSFFSSSSPARSLRSTFPSAAYVNCLVGLVNLCGGTFAAALANHVSSSTAIS